MLSIRKRGEIYYIRGTVRVGNKTFNVKEHSTGFSKLQDAREYASKLEQDIRDSALNPTADRTNKTLFDDCLRNYMSKRRPTVRELNKIKQLVLVFEGVAVSDIQRKWEVFAKLHETNALSTLNRYLALLKSIVNTAKDDLNIKPLSIPIIPVKNAKVFVLSDKVRPLLLSCYNERVRPIFITLAYQGFRTQECLQLLWEDIQFNERRIIVRTSKNGETRSVPMHNKVYELLLEEWIKRGNPVSGHVWLNSKGIPYTDTRKDNTGTSPLKSFHAVALRKLKKEYGIDLKMSIHDWRHDFASRMVMAGVDLLTVQKLGGWKSLEMVKRYATFSSQHESDAINKI